MLSLFLGYIASIPISLISLFTLLAVYFIDLTPQPHCHPTCPVKWCLRILLIYQSHHFRLYSLSCAGS